MFLSTPKFITGLLFLTAATWSISSSSEMDGTVTHRGGGRLQAPKASLNLAYRATGRAPLLTSSYRASERGLQGKLAQPLAYRATGRVDLMATSYRASERGISQS